MSVELILSVVAAAVLLAFNLSKTIWPAESESVNLQELREQQ